MAKMMEIYKCEACGNIVEVIHGGDGDLVCCGEPMKLMADKTEDKGQEKHVPVIEKTDKGYKVTVGSVKHPMEEEHYIEWIALCADGVTYRHYLNPGEEPVAEFCIEADEVTAHELCNVHGLWKKE